jgi:hypothetical protein
LVVKNSALLQEPSPMLPRIINTSTGEELT